MLIMDDSSRSDMPLSSADSVMAGQINTNSGADDCYSMDSTSSSTYISTPNDSTDHSMRDHAISTDPARVRSSSCCSGAAMASREEGQGESRGDQQVRTSSTSRTPADGKHFCANMAMALKHMGSANRHTSSAFCEDIQQEQEYFQQILGSSSFGWTDEKHSSYLDCMEADFLRRVMFRGNVQEQAISSELSDSASSEEALKSCSKEFKICQNGRWRPMGSGVQPSLVAGPVAQLAVAVKNPWIKRFRPSSKHSVTPWVLQDPLLQAAMDSRSRSWRGQQSCDYI